MKKLFISLLSVLSASVASAADFPVTIESCGTPVTFSGPPKRAVINDLNMAEMAFALDLQDRIVGLTGISGWYKMTPEFKRRWARSRTGTQISHPETLLAAEPDFFFAGWNYGMKVGGEVTPDTLSKYGIKTFVLSESCVFTTAHKNKATMDLLYNDILTLGKIFGKRNDALSLVSGWQKRLSELPKPAAGTRPLKVFVYDSGEDKPFTSGKYAMPTAMIEAAGGKNAMEALDTSWGTTSWESVAATEPDFIILLDYQTGSGADTLRHFLENHPLMKLTPAVQHHRYLKLQYAELTPGPANVGAVEKLAWAMYPTEAK